MPSEQLNNVVGALGGAVLAGCLAPQLLKLYTTRSARDLSYLFLLLYNIGLLLTFVYLFYEGAFAGWVCILVELGFGCVMVCAKAYLDNFAPNSSRSAQEAQHETASKLTNSQSLASDVRIDISDFVLGTAAPFPLLKPEPSHVVQHLLIDIRMAVPAAFGAADLEAGTPAFSMHNKAGQTGEGRSLMAQLCSLLEGSLAAAGIPAQRSQHQAIPSFRRRQAAVPSAVPSVQEEDKGLDECEQGGTSDMAFLNCGDGFVTVILYPGTASLSLDFLAASDVAVPCMGAAAQHLCERLEAAFPGTKVAARAVARLPRQ